LVPILSQMNPFLILLPYLFKIHYNIVLSMPTSSKMFFLKIYALKSYM